MGDVIRTVTSEQGWSRKQSTQVKQLNPRNKNALARVTLEKTK